MTCLKLNDIDLVIKCQRKPFKNQNLTIFFEKIKKRDQKIQKLGLPFDRKSV